MNKKDQQQVIKELALRIEADTGYIVNIDNSNPRDGRLLWVASAEAGVKGIEILFMNNVLVLGIAIEKTELIPGVIRQLTHAGLQLIKNQKNPRFTYSYDNFLSACEILTKSSTALAFHQEEFTYLAQDPQHIDKVRNRISAIQQALINEDFSLLKKLKFRDLHDWLGWQSQYTHSNEAIKYRFSGCSGTMYRSAKFMEIQKVNRDGRASPKQNIHVEHVIPDHLIAKLIWGTRNDLGTLEKIFNFVMQFSICAAVTRGSDECRGCSKKCGKQSQNCEQSAIDYEREIEGITCNWTRRHPGIRVEGDEAFLETEYPFLRYIGAHDVQIYNMHAGDLIDPNLNDFTFDDHWECLQNYEAFRWSTYDDE